MPGAKLITIPGMGHDLPEALWGEIIDAIVANTELAPAEHGALAGAQPSSALAAATEASQAALGLVVRAKVCRSTPTMPKRGR